MADSWEEALDLDDSDLPSLRPSKRNHPPTIYAAAAVSASQPSLRRCSLTQSTQNPQNLLSQPTLSPPLIPGPAGTVQSAMIRRRKNSNYGIGRDDFEQEVIPTQEYIRRAVEEGIEDDDDFSGDPWLSAVDYVRRQGLADGDGAIGVPLSAIKSGFNMDKVAQVVAIVKTCTPNGLGGLMVTLKDPTGTIDATIHGRVLTEGEFGKDISIGAAIIIRKVTVFAPSRSARYINITLNNMVKVFPKDVGVPMKQHSAPPMSKHGVPVNVAGHNESPIPQKPSSLSQGMTEEIINSLIQKEDLRGCSNDDGQAKRDKMTINQDAASGREQLTARQDADNGAEEIPYRTDKGKNIEAVVCQQLNNLNPSSQAASGNILGGAVSQHGSSAVHLNCGVNNKENGDAIGTNRKQPTDSSFSLPEWTDEQLDELFSFD